MTIDVKTFRIVARENNRVRYVPTHAEGNLEHKDCKDGRISSFSEHYVFVLFDRDAAHYGWHATVKACDPNDLRIL